MSHFLHYINDKRPILLIDDCAVYRSAVKGMLKKLGFNAKGIVAVANARDAGLAVRNANFKLILCDYNLNESTNGCQLLEQLKKNRLISHSCVLIIITGDSSQSVVSGFAELEPDGYIVKPLNYLTLSKRLPKWIIKKQILKNLYSLVDKNKHEDVVAHAETLSFKNQDLNDEVTLMKGEALGHLNDIERAKNTLEQLKGTRLESKSALLLSSLYIKNGDLNAAKLTLDEILAEKPNCAKTKKEYAELALKFKHYSMALKMINESLIVTPYNVEKHLLKLYIALSCFKEDLALSTLNQIQLLTQFSTYNTLDLLFMKLSLLIDSFSLPQSKEQRNKISNAIKDNLSALRKDYEKSKRIKFDLLFKARMALAFEKRKEATNHYETYIEHIKEAENSDNNFIESMERLKVETYLFDEIIARKNLASIKDIVNSEEIKVTCYVTYIEQWQNVVFKNRKKLLYLVDEMDISINLKNYDTAIKYALSAFMQAPHNLRIAKSMLFILTKSWPQGQDKHQVKELALICRQVVVNHTGQLDQESNGFFCTLVNQLGVNQLA